MIFSVFWRCGRRSRGMLRVRVAARKTTNSTNWPKCCRCRRPSRLSWTRHPSSGSPFPSCASKNSPVAESRPGSRKIPPNPSKVHFLPFFLFFFIISFIELFILSYFIFIVCIYFIFIIAFYH